MKKTVVAIFTLASLYCEAQNFIDPKGKKDYLVTIGTSLGDIKLVLFDETPLHKENFLKLAKAKFYDSTTFHRVIKGFMIQGGDPNSKDTDPNNDGVGGPGYTVPAEFNTKFSHNQGALAAARMGDGINPQKESSGSQFYIVDNKEGTHFLDNNYTVFGQVIKGIDVVEQIASVQKDGRDRPLTSIIMKVSFEKMKKKKITKKIGYAFPK